MVGSVHLADVSVREVPRVLRARPRKAPGLRYAEVVTAARLSPGLRPHPIPGRVALVSFWDDDAALDAFVAESPVARSFADGWHVRLQPLRATGEWPGITPLVDATQPVDDDEPVAVLTYGKLRLRKALPFLRTSGVAEADAVTHPAVLAGTALARPPRTVSTFSLWRTAAEMREYAYRGVAHQEAMAGMRRDNYHSQYLFARFRPYGAQGLWDGRQPIATS